MTRSEVLWRASPSSRTVAGHVSSTEFRTPERNDQVGGFMEGRESLEPHGCGARQLNGVLSKPVIEMFVLAQFFAVDFTVWTDFFDSGPKPGGMIQFIQVGKFVTDDVIYGFRRTHD
jgi:hypothetical protein